MKRPRPGTPAQDEDQKAAALTAAALECARRLGLTPGDTATVLGVHQGVLVAMKKGERAVDGMSGEAECADALVRIVKRLNAVQGEAETHWRSWLRRESPGLGGKPLDLMLQRYGVVKVADYVEHADPSALAPTAR